jgi:hypothetical protein
MQADNSRSLDHLYAKSVEGTEDQFNRRNGVFYPSGFALLAMPDEDSVRQAVDALTQNGLQESEITLLRPEQMHQLTDQSQHDAGLLSRIVAAELKQMTVLEQLAETGHHFLLVKNTDETGPLLQTVGAKARISKGLAFHTLAVEELPVDKETIPGKSPFGVNEVIRTQDSDADMSGDHRP